MISTFVEAKPRMSESAREVEDKEPLMAEFAPEVEGKQPLMTDFATDIEAEERPAPKQSRLKIALTILFHSTCAISSTLITKTALNSLDAPILLLALQFTVQVGLLTAIGVPMGYIKPLKPFTVRLSKYQTRAPLFALHFPKSLSFILTFFEHERPHSRAHPSSFSTLAYTFYCRHGYLFFHWPSYASLVYSPRHIVLLQLMQHFTRSSVACFCHSRSSSHLQSCARCHTFPQSLLLASARS